MGSTDMAKDEMFVVDVDGTRRAMTPAEIAALPSPPVVTEDDYRRAIQLHVDATAQSRRYDNGNSLASYKDSTIPQWSDEAVAFIAWRDQVWLYAYAELDKVMAGEREQPSVEEFIGELPKMEWQGA